MLSFVGFGLAVISFGAGALGAWYWFKSSQIAARPSWGETGAIEPVIPEVSTQGWIAALLQAAQASGALNKTAALYTGVAVAAGTLSNLIASWPW